MGLAGALAGALASLVGAATAHHVVAARRAPGLAGALASLAGTLAPLTGTALAAHHGLRIRRHVRGRIHGRHAHILKEAAHHVHVHTHIVAAGIAARVAARVTTSVGHFLYIGMRK